MMMRVRRMRPKAKSFDVEGDFYSPPMVLVDLR
jgi:hypothetical protein